MRRGSARDDGRQRRADDDDDRAREMASAMRASAFKPTVVTLRARCARVDDGTTRWKDGETTRRWMSNDRRARVNRSFVITRP